MKRVLPFIAGFLSAAILALALAFTVVLPWYGRESFDSGRRTGVVEAHRNLLPKIQTMLGDDYRKSDGYQTLFEVKTDAAVVVERNGVKTLRVYAERP